MMLGGNLQGDKAGFLRIFVGLWGKSAILDVEMSMQLAKSASFSQHLEIEHEHFRVRPP